MCIRVDLPDPDGPMTAVSRPRSISTETSRSAVTVVSPCPYCRVTPDATRTGPRPSCVGCASSTIAKLPPAPGGRPATGIHPAHEAAPNSPGPAPGRALTVRALTAPVRVSRPWALASQSICPGPNRRVPMAELRALLGEARLTPRTSRTYVQSGNVVLDSDASPVELEARTAQASSPREIRLRGAGRQPHRGGAGGGRRA